MRLTLAALLFLGIASGCTTPRPPANIAPPPAEQLENERRIGALRDARCVSLLREQGKIRQYGEGLVECVKKGSASDMLYVSPVLRWAPGASRHDNEAMLWADARNAVFRVLHTARHFCETPRGKSAQERCVRAWLADEENRVEGLSPDDNPLMRNLPVIETRPEATRP